MQGWAGQVHRWMGVAALCTLAWPFAAGAGEQAARAVAAVRQLQASGEIAPGSVLRLRAKQGNMVSLLGRDFQLQQAWERATGVPIDASVMPQVDSLGLLRRGMDVDLTVARNHEYADLLEEGLAEDLTPLLRRFGFSLGGDDLMLVQQQAMVGERVLAIPADLDVPLLFLRKDLLEDPAHRARFKAVHGRELALPRTWAQYQDTVNFFCRAREGFYGVAEPRERDTGWMYWMPRYASASAPNQHLFDEQMRPLIDSPAGVAATESYIATVACSPPQVLEDGKDYSYTLPYFLRGQAFATILTTAGAKIANRDDSAVRGRFIAAPLPGRIVQGRLLRRTPLIYGNNLVVPRSARNKALALLFAMWLTDADNALRSVGANGIADPYRFSTLADEPVQRLYRPETLQTLRDVLPSVTPSGTGLPGDSEYLAALSRQLWLAAAGKLSAKAAMRQTAREWEAITERLGRTRQVGHWQAARRLYPSDRGSTP